MLHGEACGEVVLDVCGVVPRPVRNPRTKNLTGRIGIARAHRCEPVIRTVGRRVSEVANELVGRIRRIEPQVYGDFSRLLDGRPERVRSTGQGGRNGLRYRAAADSGNGCDVANERERVRRSTDFVDAKRCTLAAPYRCDGTPPLESRFAWTNRCRLSCRQFGQRTDRP